MWRHSQIDRALISGRSNASMNDVKEYYTKLQLSQVSLVTASVAWLGPIFHAMMLVDSPSDQCPTAVGSPTPIH